MKILKAQEIANMEAPLQSHPLNPDSLLTKRKLGDAAGLSHFGFNMVAVMPGQNSTEYHRHLYEEECIYILSGIGEAESDDKCYTVGEGDFLGFSRNGPAHSLTNTGSEPLVLLVAGQRLEHDVCEYPRRNLRLYINGDKEDYVSFDDASSEPPQT